MVDDVMPVINWTAHKVQISISSKSIWKYLVITLTKVRVIIFMELKISSSQEIWETFHHWGQTKVNAIISLTEENLEYATKSCVKNGNEALEDKVQLYYSNPIESLN